MISRNCHDHFLPSTLLTSSFETNSNYSPLYSILLALAPSASTLLIVVAVSTPDAHFAPWWMWIPMRVFSVSLSPSVPVASHPSQVECRAHIIPPQLQSLAPRWLTNWYVLFPSRKRPHQTSFQKKEKEKKCMHILISSLLRENALVSITHFRRCWRLCRAWQTRLVSNGFYTCFDSRLPKVTKELCYWMNFFGTETGLIWKTLWTSANCIICTLPSIHGPEGFSGTQQRIFFFSP